MSADKTYIYKVYSGGIYQGVLSPVVSNFELREEINTAGTSIDIDLGVSLSDIAPTVTVDTLVDESANQVVDQNGDNVVTGITYDTGILPALNDKIEVWEFNDTDVNGVLRFTGLVSKWRANYSNNTIRITILSYGVQLDNFIVQVLPEETLVENPLVDTTTGLYSPWKTPVNRVVTIAQSFQVPGESEVLKIYLTIGNSGTMTTPCVVSIVEGLPTAPGATIGTVTRNIDPQATQSTFFQFATPVTLLGSTDYHFKIENGGFGAGVTQILDVGTDTTAAYASGTMYSYNDSSGWSSTANDIGFTIVSDSGAIGNQFNSRDPSSIVRELLDSFGGLGGNLTYTDDSIADTGTSVSYTFKFNTYLEALNKCIELAPANWYWYVDPATGVVYFQPKGNTKDHILTLGTDFSDFELEYSLEDMKNKVRFSGGDTGSGTNLLTVNSNDTSIAQYGNWLSLPSDNRVTLESTADILSQAILNEFAYPKFRANVSVVDGQYDTSSIRIGEIVGFANFNSLVNSLQLQVMSKVYNRDFSQLSLEVLPPSTSKRIEDIRRNLSKQQTENNPDTF